VQIRRCLAPLLNIGDAEISVSGMKISFSTLCCPSWNLRQMIDAAVANQITGIDFRGLGEEIDITKLAAFNGEIDATLDVLRGAGLSLPCFNTSVTLVSPAAERWQTMLEECHRYATLAAKTNTRYLRIFCGEVPKGMTRDEARMMASRHLRQVIKICAGTGAQPLIETHDTWSTGTALLELLHEFDPAEVGVLWDFEHSFRHGEAPAETARTLRKYIKHAHVKDSVLQDKHNVPRMLGEGDLPLREAFAACREIGYDGWFCLEVEKRWIPDAPEPEVTIPQFAEFMRAHWKQ
jgi:sugar phosphate isomerase/epimerase